MWLFDVLFIISGDFLGIIIGPETARNRGSKLINLNFVKEMVKFVSEFQK